MFSIIKHLGYILCVAGATGLATAQGGSALTELSRIVGGQRTEINAAPVTVALLNNRLLEQTGSFSQSQFFADTAPASDPLVKSTTTGATGHWILVTLGLSAACRRAWLHLSAKRFSSCQADQIVLFWIADRIRIAVDSSIGTTIPPSYSTHQPPDIYGSYRTQSTERL